MERGAVMVTSVAASPAAGAKSVTVGST